MNVPFIQVNLFQKLAKSAEHVMYQIILNVKTKIKTTICVHNVFCRYSELTIFMNNEQFVVILWLVDAKIRASDKDLPVLLEYTHPSQHPVSKTCGSIGCHCKA